MNALLKSAPLWWKLLLGFLLALPFIQTGYFFHFQEFQPLELSSYFQTENIIIVFLVYLPFLIFLGMYFMKRWAWILLTEYSLVYLLFISMELYKSPVTDTLYPEILTVLVFVVILVKNRKYVKIAYREDFLARGWRNARRFPLAIPVTIGNSSYITTDISYTGLAVSGSVAPIAEKIHDIALQFSGKNIKIPATRARESETITGFKFHDLDRNTRRILKKHIKSQRKLDYQKSRITDDDL